MDGDRGLTELLLYVIPDLEYYNLVGGIGTAEQYDLAWSEAGYYLESLIDNKGNLGLLVDYLKTEFHAKHDIDPQIQKLRELLESATIIADKVSLDGSLSADLRLNFINLGYKCSDWIDWIDRYFPPEQSKQEQNNEKPVKQDEDLTSYLLVQADKQDELLKKLHLLIDGKKGKSVALVIHLCVELGLMSKKPTFGVLTAEFGNIGNASGFNSYYGKYETSYTKEEKDGLKRHFEPFLEYI